MAQNTTPKVTTNIPISSPLRDALRIECAKRGISYDQLLRAELDLELEE
jgi:predicted DNA binding CopG/RHH family protein